ncbi:MAG: TonB-dependent receptor family protein [Chitinophagaceae bacterium]|jgi:outer membrane receptor protein involved in Fe transport|nr:TonB-dependent receptor family protein [Chitinophagaceae bacterium]
MKYLFLLATTLLSFTQLFAQYPGAGNRGGGARGGANMNVGHFYGKFVDATTNKPIEGVSVLLYGNKFDSVTRTRKEVVLKTIITAGNGDFSFDGLAIMGTYKLKAMSIGYKNYDKTLKFDIKMGGGDVGGNQMEKMIGMTDVDLGNIKMQTNPNDLANVTVTASKQLFEMGIDRKVFNVDKNLVSTGQTATEIMKTIPSLSVDVDGNVELRNAAPQIFVDGRPTTLTLDQIPADIIEKVEIITNPSAKFDASGGNAGIINIVLKKNKKNGYNGGLRAGIDSRARINLGGDFNLRQNKVNFFASANYNQRKSISVSDASTKFTTPTTMSVLSSSDNTSNGYFAFFRGGLDYFVDNRNTISVTANITRGNFDNEGLQRIDTNSTNLVSMTDRNTLSQFNFQNFGGQLSYKHNFTKNGHSIAADINYNSSTNSNETDINNTIYNAGGSQKYPLFQQRSLGDGTNDFLTLQLDYENQLSENTKFEAGIRTAIRDFKTDNLQYLNNNISGSNFVLSPRSSSRYKFNDQVHAAYATYSFKYKKFSYQLGLRAESSNYTGNLLTLNGGDSSTFKVNFPLSLFPSAFITYKLTDKQDLQLNYSRRVNRPSFFQLLPVYDFTDPQNPSVGNPALNPEFTSSFEISYNNSYKRNANFLATAYFKYSTNLITRYIYQDVNKNVQPGVVADDSLFYTSNINANNSYTYGLELTNKFPVNKWWDLTLNLNLYNSQINANIPGQSIDNSIVSWFGKVNNNFKITKSLSLQVSGDARSRTLLPQGGGGGGRGGRGGGGMMWGGGSQTLAQGYTLPRYFDVDIALRKDFTWKKGRTASLTFSMNNIFRTATETYTEAIFFTQETFRLRDPQVLRINFSYRFGKFDISLFKRKNNKAEGGDSGDMGGVGM